MASFGAGPGASFSSGGGSAAYGSKPQDIPMPNPFGDLSAIYPNLSATNSQASSNILSELQGQLSPATINNIRNNAASFGVSSGMPGSQLQGYSGLASLGKTTEQLQQQGLTDYLNSITGISKTQTVDPSLQADVNTQNSVWNAAPDPAAAAQTQQSLFNQYLNKLSSPAGGTGSGLPWYDEGQNMPFALPPGSYQAGGVWHTPAAA